MSLLIDQDTAYWGIIGIMAIGAIGIGIVMSPATNSIMGSVPVNRAGVGSALNDSTRLVGGALGIAVLGTIMNRVYRGDIEALISGVPSLPDDAFKMAQSSIQGAHIIAESIPDAGVSGMIADIANQGFVSGMNDAFMVAAAVMAAASILALVILPSKVRSWREG